VSSVDGNIGFLLQASRAFKGITKNFVRNFFSRPEALLVGGKLVHLQRIPLHEIFPPVVTGS
jgi:hypothetical protein